MVARGKKDEEPDSARHKTSDGNSEPASAGSAAGGLTDATGNTPATALKQETEQSQYAEANDGRPRNATTGK